MAMMNEREITALCNLATLIVAHPSQGESITKKILKPRPVLLAGRLVEPVCSVPPRPSEFTRAVCCLKQISKQLPTNPAAVGKMALIAEKMMRSKNGPRREAGGVLMWAIMNRLISESALKKEDRKISKRDTSVAGKAIRRVIAADL